MNERLILIIQKQHLKYTKRRGQAQGNSWLMAPLAEVV
jgi:hypothetical protein